MSYLLDTNVISELICPKPNKKVLQWFQKIPDETLYISVLTLGEIRKGVEACREHKRKEQLRVWLEIDLPAWFGNRILLLDRLIADRWGRLQNEVKKPIPAIDSLIATTALHHDLRLVTRNHKDFGYSTLQVVNPWED
ncbi:MAG: type II toxin-antitoxin system VapC family toxin [Gammaproteobacteria bacterium]